MIQNIALFLALFITSTSFAAVEYDYKINEQTFEGFVAKPKHQKDKMPGVLVIHDWMGLTAKTKEKAKRIADLGYVVFAMDVFGKGVRPKNSEEASANAKQYYENRELLRQRITAGFEQLKKVSRVDLSKLVAVGYCFGGTSALELSRAGTPDLIGVVSFHGGLDSTNVEDGKKIKAKILALHGADDPYVTPEKLSAFETEMKSGGVDWRLVKYGNTVHSFTDKSAGTDNSKGAAYNELSDKRSWIEMQNFFKEIF